MRVSYVNIRVDILNALFLGLLSFALGLIQFNIPGIEGAVSSLNEIPLLTSVLHLSKAIFLPLVIIISSLNTPAEGSILSTIIMHVGGLIPFWYYYHLLMKPQLDKRFLLCLLSILGVVLYYYVLVLPLMVITNQLFIPNSPDFIPLYQLLFKSVSFEVLTSSLIFTLYVLQYYANYKLKQHINTVEEQIQERTQKLDENVQKLNSANRELSSFNQHLDSLLLERTQTLSNRNHQLSSYAFVNAHLLRAPLARILGLASLIEMNLEKSEDPDFRLILDKFSQSCDELDKIVRLLSEVISEESALDEKQIHELQEKIRNISQKLASAV